MIRKNAPAKNHNQPILTKNSPIIAIIASARVVHFANFTNLPISRQTTAKTKTSNERIPKSVHDPTIDDDSVFKNPKERKVDPKTIRKITCRNAIKNVVHIITNNPSM